MHPSVQCVEVRSARSLNFPCASPTRLVRGRPPLRGPGPECAEAVSARNQRLEHECRLPVCLLPWPTGPSR